MLTAYSIGVYCYSPDLQSIGRERYETRCIVCVSVRLSVTCLSLLLLAVRGPWGISVTQDESESALN